MTNDPYHIIPCGAAPGSIVRNVDLQIRFIADFDSTYFQDRLCADLFANGKPLGIHAKVVMDDTRWRDPYQAIERYGPDLERVVLERLAGHGNQRRVDELECQVRALAERLNRPRWWHGFSDFWWRIRAAL